MNNFYIHESSYLDDNVFIGEGTRIWHFCHVQKGAIIGKRCTLGQNVYIGFDVRIGNNVKIQNNVSVYNGVEIEDYVFCGPSCVFTNDLTPRCDSFEFRKTFVRYGASICANATIVCGHTIGKWAMIAAGAVVACDVPDYAMMRGVPAKRYGWVCECGKTLNNSLRCPRCEKEYSITPRGLILSTSEE